MVRTEGRVEIHAPLELVFDLFSNLERWPQWMSNVKTVLRVGEDLTQWIATTQKGNKNVNWLAETTVFKRNQEFGWRSVGGDLEAEAEANFTESEHGVTSLRVLIKYSGEEEGAATPLGDAPARQLSADLENFRRTVEQEARRIEAADIPSAAAKTTGRLEPEFLKRNHLPHDSAPHPHNNTAEPEEFTLEKSISELELESDFGRALESIGRRPDKTNTVPSNALTAAVAAPPLVQAETPTPQPPAVTSPAETPLLPPPSPATSVASKPSMALPLQSTPSWENANQRITPSTQPTQAAVNERSARYTTLIYLIFALAAFFGSVAGFWLASPKTAAVEEPSAAAEITTTAAAPSSGGEAETGESTASESPAAAATTANVPPAARTQQQQQQSSEESPEPILRESLADWIATTNARDMNRLVAFYMPVVDTFYQKSKVKRAAVRAEKVRVIEKADVVRIKAAQPTVKISDNGNRATMRFRKTYVIESNRNSRRGEVLQELIWQKTSSGWKIISERDLRAIR